MSRKLDLDEEFVGRGDVRTQLTEKKVRAKDKILS